MGEIFVNADATPTNNDGRGQVGVFILKRCSRDFLENMNIEKFNILLIWSNARDIISLVHYSLIHIEETLGGLNENQL